MYNRINSTKSIDSGADNISVPTTMSKVGSMGEDVCAWIRVFLQTEQ